MIFQKYPLFGECRVKIFRSKKQFFAHISKNMRCGAIVYCRSLNIIPRPNRSFKYIMTEKNLEIDIIASKVENINSPTFEQSFVRKRDIQSKSLFERKDAPYPYYRG